MYELFLTLHLLAAIFAIGPLTHAVTTASRGLRTADESATRAASRMVSIYSYASVVVVIFGFGLMSMKAPWNNEPVAQFSELWIWLSVVLWVIAVAIALAVVVPALDKATAALGRGESVSAMTGRVAGSGGVIALLFLVIVILMVYQPA